MMGSKGNALAICIRPRVVRNNEKNTKHDNDDNQRNDMTRNRKSHCQKKKNTLGGGVLLIVHLKIKEHIDEKMNLYIGSSFFLCATM